MRAATSPSTFYRLLRTTGETRGRRNELTHPAGPRVLWSWEVAKLKGPVKWVCYHLYVILDVFSRYVVGWMIAPRESAELARRLQTTIARFGASDYRRSRTTHLFYSKQHPSFRWFEAKVRSSTSDRSNGR